MVHLINGGMKNIMQFSSAITRSTSAPSGYDQIDDTSEGRLKVHAEEAFRAGIKFKARFIGSLEIPKPHSRVEIVAAMRKVRYEFKARSTKKKKVDVMVSVEGVRVTLRPTDKKNDPSILFDQLMHDPINRIFYVSHDSSDLNIWSYIARDAKSAAFRCTVFKTRKDTATNTVRTIGQAFDVVHRITEIEKEKWDENKDPDKTSTTSSPKKSLKSNKGTPAHCIIDNDSMESKDSTDCARLMLLRQQVELAEQETRTEKTKLKRIEVTLQAEQRARVDAEVRCEQLLRQNKELISILQKMVADDNENKDPFTELAMESIIAARNQSEYEMAQNQSVFPDTPIHMNSTALGMGKFDSINVTPINNPLMNITNQNHVRNSVSFEPLLSGSNSTLVASEREDSSGDRVLSFVLDQTPFHRERVMSAHEMLNSSTLQPKLSPHRRDRYEPLRNLGSKMNSSVERLSSSRSFSDHLSGVSSLINRPIAAIPRRITGVNQKFSSKSLEFEQDEQEQKSESDEILDDVPLHIN